MRVKNRRLRLGTKPQIWPQQCAPAATRSVWVSRVEVHASGQTGTNLNPTNLEELVWWRPLSPLSPRESEQRSTTQYARNASTTHQQAQRRGRARNTLQLGCGRSGSNHRASRRQSQRPLYPGCCARLISRRGEPLCQAPTFPTRRRRSLGWVIGEECRRCKSGRSQQLVALAMAAAHPGTVTGRDRDPWDGLSARCGLAQCRREANFL